MFAKVWAVLNRPGNAPKQEISLIGFPFPPKPCPCKYPSKTLRTHIATIPSTCFHKHVSRDTVCRYHVYISGRRIARVKSENTILVTKLALLVHAIGAALAQPKTADGHKNLSAMIFTHIVYRI